MKSEAEPIAPEEWFLRLVWRDRLTSRVPLISPNAFEPRKGEDDGIILFRRDCLGDPSDVLSVIAPDKRAAYAVVQVSHQRLIGLGLSVRADPIAAVPGHVVVPELNRQDYEADKLRFTPIKLRLAEEASEHILIRPPAEGP